MNASARPAMDVAHRARVLRALGMVPWVRRGTSTPAVAVNMDGPQNPSPNRSGETCVVVLPAGCATRELDLLGRAFGACGAWLARAARVSVDAGGQLADEPPAAGAYLVFGEAQAHALGRKLPAGVMQRAQIVLVDEPAQVLLQAAAKRRLWIALRTLRRALASTAG